MHSLGYYVTVTVIHPSKGNHRPGRREGSTRGQTHGRGRVAVVRRAEMVLLSRSEVRVNLHFIGDSDQLALALEQSDLRLFEEGGQWRLGLAGAQPKGKS